MDVEARPRPLAACELGARPYAARLGVRREAPAGGARGTARAARHRARAVARARVPRPALEPAAGRHTRGRLARPRSRRRLVPNGDVRQLDRERPHQAVEDDIGRGVRHLERVEAAAADHANALARPDRERSVAQDDLRRLLPRLRQRERERHRGTFCVVASSAASMPGCGPW